MNNKTKQMSDGILRQRRNIIAISIILPLYFISGITFEKINIFGNTATVQNPSFIVILLFALYIYFLFRYWQYFNDEKPGSEFSTLIFFHSLREYSKYYNKIIKQEFVLPNFVTHKISEQIECLYVRNRSFFYNECTKKSDFISTIYPFGITLDENHKDIIEELKHDEDWQITTGTNSKEKLTFCCRSEIILNKYYLFWLKIKGFIKAISISSFFSDYYLPFIVWGISFLFIIFYWLISSCII